MNSTNVGVNMFTSYRRLIIYFLISHPYVNKLGCLVSLIVTLYQNDWAQVVATILNFESLIMLVDFSKKYSVVCLQFIFQTYCKSDAPVKHNKFSR